MQVVREKDELKHENQEMAQLLHAHGIPYQRSFVRKHSISQNGSTYAGSSTGSFSGTSSSRGQTLEGSPYQAGLTLNGQNATGKRSPHSPVNPNNYPPYSPVKAPSPVSRSPMDLSGFPNQAQAPIGMAMTTDHKVSSRGTIPQMRDPSSIFMDDQVSLDFVL